MRKWRKMSELLTEIQARYEALREGRVSVEQVRVEAKLFTAQHSTTSQLGLNTHD